MNWTNLVLQTGAVYLLPNTPKSATKLLRYALNEFGFEVKSVKTDNESEFAKYFYAALKKLRRFGKVVLETV